MKTKTSVSIDRKILAKLKAYAKRQDRSVSYVLEKFIVARAMEIPNEGTAVPKKSEVVSYSSPKKRSSG